MEPNRHALMSPRRSAILLLTAILVLPVVLHLPTITAGFTGDEEIMYLWETKVRRPSDITRLLTMDIYKVWQQRHYEYDAYSTSSDYRPMSYLSVAVLSQFFGLYLPAYRVIALLIYGLGTLLALLLVYRLTHSPPLAWLTAGLFAIDPSRVGYISHGVIYLGGTVVALYLASAHSYIVARTTIHATGRSWLYGLSLLAALAAYFTHELAFSLFLAILLIEWWGGVMRRQWVFQPLLTLPYALLAACYYLTRTMVESRFHADTHMLRLTDPRDLLYAGIQTGTRFIMLFVPNFERLRRSAKAWVFGDLPGQTILAAHPDLTATVVGLLLAAVAAMVWTVARPRVWRFLLHDERGQWCVLATAWSLAGIAPLVLSNVVSPKHVVFSALGADLLKALGIATVTTWLCRRWAWNRRWLYAGLLIPFVLYSMMLSVPGMHGTIQNTRLTQVLSTDAVRLIREAAMDDRPTVVYLLNAGADSASVGMQELVQAALGRDNIRVVVPYLLGWRGPAYPHDPPQVTITHEEIRVENNPDHPHYIFLIHYDLSKIKTGLRLRNGDLYTLEVVEAEDALHNPLRLVIRYDRPAGTRILFLQREPSRLVRHDVG